MNKVTSKSITGIKKQIGAINKKILALYYKHVNYVNPKMQKLQKQLGVLNKRLKLTDTHEKTLKAKLRIETEMAEKVNEFQHKIVAFEPIPQVIQKEIKKKYQWMAKLQ